MLENRELPPLMFYLLWGSFTRLAKEVAVASIYGSCLDVALERQSRNLRSALAGQPKQLEAALIAQKENATLLMSASDPNNLWDKSDGGHLKIKSLRRIDVG